MILVVANNDLELLALRTAVESLPEGFPPVRAHGGVGLDQVDDLPSIDGVRVVLVRLHKGRSAWEAPFDELRRTCRAGGIALLAFGGEAGIDAELAGLSTVQPGIVAEAAAYWAAGGPRNLAHLLRFVADTVLLEGFGFDPPQVLPAAGILGDRPYDPERPTVAVVTYRANVLAGNTLPVEQLCDAIESRGANARAVHCYSLRPGPNGTEPAALEHLRGADVVVTTTWAAGGVVRDGDARGISTGEAWTSPLDVLDDRTITLTAVDPLQDAPGTDDDIVVPINELQRGVGVLIVRAGGQAGERFALDSDLTRLGRHPDSEIPLDDITVSRRHAEIQRTAEGYMVADSGSLNGTYVNQERVERAHLLHGDELQVGKFRLVFFERTDG